MLFLMVFALSSKPMGAMAQESELTEAQLEALNRALDNPISQVWSLAFQNNTAWLNANVLDGPKVANVFSFQPILPAPIGDDWLFFARPVFNLVTVPNFIGLEEPYFRSNRTGFGDMIFAAGFGPNKKKGLLWGFGVSAVFPTASFDAIGSGKWQMGPAGILFWLHPKFLIGTLVQQWWSFAGQSDRPETNHASFLTYVIVNLPKKWQLRYNPNITVDWNIKEGKKALFPVGIGVGKLTKLGKLPIKLMVEGQYAVVKPNLLAPLNNLPLPGAPGLDAGLDWILRFQINFVIPSPFGDIYSILKDYE